MSVLFPLLLYFTHISAHQGFTVDLLVDIFRNITTGVLMGLFKMNKLDNELLNLADNALKDDKRQNTGLFRLYKNAVIELLQHGYSFGFIHEQFTRVGVKCSYSGLTSGYGRLGVRKNTHLEINANAVNKPALKKTTGGNSGKDQHVKGGVKSEQTANEFASIAELNEQQKQMEVNSLDALLDKRESNSDVDEGNLTITERVRRRKSQGVYGSDFQRNTLDD